MGNFSNQAVFFHQLRQHFNVQKKDQPEVPVSFHYIHTIKSEKCHKVHNPLKIRPDQIWAPWSQNWSFRARLESWHQSQRYLPFGPRRRERSRDPGRPGSPGFTHGFTREKWRFNRPKWWFNHEKWRFFMGISEATEMVIQQGIFDGHRAGENGRFIRPYYDLARPRKGLTGGLAESS